MLNGAVVVHCLPTTAIKTFNKYAKDVFFPHLEKQLQGMRTARLDVLWDAYNPESMNESKALTMFHSLSGCDTTFSFRRKGKKTFCQDWLTIEEVTKTLAHLSLVPTNNITIITIYIIIIMNISVLCSCVKASTKKFSTSEDGRRSRFPSYFNSLFFLRITGSKSLVASAKN